AIFPPRSSRNSGTRTPAAPRTPSARSGRLDEVAFFFQLAPLRSHRGRGIRGLRHSCVRALGRSAVRQPVVARRGHDAEIVARADDRVRGRARHRRGREPAVRRHRMERRHACLDGRSDRRHRDHALSDARLHPDDDAARLHAADRGRAQASAQRGGLFDRADDDVLVGVRQGAQVAARNRRSGILMGVTLDSLWLGFSVALQPAVLWYAFLGCLVGTLVGVLPGIGPLAGISILLPITFGLNATNAIVMLAGIYYGSQYGGSTTSILLRIPGEASSVMTCIDGNAMARKGRAGAALCIAAVGSWIAGTFGVIV